MNHSLPLNQLTIINDFVKINFEFIIKHTIYLLKVLQVGLNKLVIIYINNSIKKIISEKINNK